MSFVFEDRKSNYPYRYKVTPLSGESYYVYLERADEPTVVGTPLNADTFNTILKEFNLAGVLPTVSEENNGAFLRVMGGMWKADSSGEDMPIAVDAFVSAETHDDTSIPKTTERATCLVFTDGEEYILHSVKVATTTDTSVKFVLFNVGENKLTQLAVLGEVLSSGGFAELTIDKGYRVPKNTAIVAICSTNAIEAYTIDGGMSFEDVTLSGSDDIEIPFTEGSTDLARMGITIVAPTAVPINDFSREVSFILQNLDHTISSKVDQYVEEALGGDY
jgi:hypothetical protein